MRFDAADDDQRHHDRQDRNGAGDHHQTLGGVGIQKVPRHASGDREADDHHEPHECRGSRLPLRRHLFGKQCQQRCSGGTGPYANGKETEGRDTQTQPVLARDECRAQCSKHASQTQNKHAANDPGRASAAHIGAVADARACQLYDVMNGDQKARDRRSQGQFDHHDAI